MRRVLTVAVALAVAAPAAAAHRVSAGMFVAESAAGFGGMVVIGGGLALGINRISDNNWAALGIGVAGGTIGTAGGAYLVGELADGRSRYPYKSFGAAVGGAACSALIVAGLFFIPYFGPFIALPVPAVMTTGLYNAVKKTDHNECNNYTGPTPSLSLLPSQSPGGKPVPLVGVTWAF